MPTSRVPDRFTAFFSWQSDLGRQVAHEFIASALAQAAVNLRSAGYHVSIDEATRDEVGSPNIPETIIQKICAADIFVADVSTIQNKGQVTPRPVQNPNVLFELGYAVAMLGWSRIILVLNTAHSEFPRDLPFDIDRQRAMHYRMADADVSDKGKRTQSKNDLVQKFEDGIKAILQAQPDRPVRAVLDRAAVEHERDARTLKGLLYWLSFNVLEMHTQHGPKRIYDRVVAHWEMFDACWRSLATHVHDARLRAAIDRVHADWAASLAATDYYLPAPNGNFAVWTNESMQTELADSEYEQCANATLRLRDSVRALQTLVAAEYLEIDAEAIFSASWNDYDREEDLDTRRSDPEG